MSVSISEGRILATAASRAVPVVGHADDLYAALPVIDLATKSSRDLFGAARGQLEQVLPDYLQQQRWFAGKSQVIDSVHISDVIPVGDRGHLAMLDVRYADAQPEMYALGLTKTVVAEAHAGEKLLAPLVRVQGADGTFIVSDAMSDAGFTRGLVDAMKGQRTLDGSAGTIKGVGGGALDSAIKSLDDVAVTPLSLHTSNTSVKLTEPAGDASVLKLVRRHDLHLTPGTPSRGLDVFKGSWLTDHTNFGNTPGVYGSLEYAARDGAPRTLAVLSEFMPNDGDSWTHALSQVGDVLNSAVSSGADHPDVAAGIASYAKTAA
ncbi:MAG: hypothetical protein H7123_02470, partial [Thermoleophilia bacterium]|nr:hypothetical protein [Thermoleophilia bacterium]